MPDSLNLKQNKIKICFLNTYIFCKGITSTNCKPRYCYYYFFFFFFIDSYWLCKSAFYYFYLFTESRQWDTLINITALSVNVNAAQTQHRRCFSPGVPRQQHTQHKHSETGKPCSCKSYKGRLEKNTRQNTGRQHRHKQKHRQTTSTQQHNIKVNKTDKPKVFVELPAATRLICS